VTVLASVAGRRGTTSAVTWSNHTKLAFQGSLVRAVGSLLGLAVGCWAGMRRVANRAISAMMASSAATGICLSELAGICCCPGDLVRSVLDLHAREIRIRGKGRTARTVKISHQAARSLDRYLRARARHPQAWRPQLWLGVNGRGPMTTAGIYQAVARRGRQCGITVYPHRFRHHFSHTWLDRGGAGRDLMELNGWTSPRRCSPATAPAPAAPAPAAATTASRTTPLDPPRRTPPGSTP